MTKIWLFTYSHKYGTDNAVYTTQDLAIRSAAKTLWKWVQNCLIPGDSQVELTGKDAAEFSTLYQQERYADAVEFYNENNRACEIVLVEELVLNEELVHDK